MRLFGIMHPKNKQDNYSSNLLKIMIYLLAAWYVRQYCSQNPNEGNTYKNCVTGLIVTTDGRYPIHEYHANAVKDYFIMLIQGSDYLDYLKNLKPNALFDLVLMKSELQTIQKFITQFNCPYAYLDYQDKNHNNQTALMLATNSGNKDLVEFLLSVHADPNLVDANGNKAINMTDNESIRAVLYDYMQTYKRYESILY